MADIDVVPKHRSNVWLWIVLAIVAIALLIWAMTGRSHNAAELHSESPTMSAMASPAIVGWTIGV
jgi:hypothetical protein